MNEWNELRGEDGPTTRGLISVRPTKFRAGGKAFYFRLLSDACRIDLEKKVQCLMKGLAIEGQLR